MNADERTYGGKTFPVLYGVSSKGAVKQWKILVNDVGTHSEIVVEHGQKDGKMQRSVVTVSEGKNLGRSNETTPFQQACLEAESKWKKQHDKNYRETLVDPGMGKIQLKLLPVLAQKYHERKQYIQWPAYVQPKLNGVRCLVECKGGKIFYWSRKAKLYKNFSYMDREFLSFMHDGELLDGEIYNHGDITFQKLCSLVKEEKNPDIDALKKYVKFHCYDHPMGNLGFKQRYMEWNVPTLKFEYIRFVHTVQIQTEKELKNYHGTWVALGYEGTIIRSGGDDPYRFQYRDNQLQKYKDFIDSEFKIVGCSDGKGKDEGKAIFRCQSSSTTGGSYGDGTFDVRCKGTYEMREEQWLHQDQYMGKMLTVRYQTLSDEGIPIFPVGIVVRDYE